ncbi:pyridoxal phosphate-dependent aminotransferase [Clostridium vincentii]|uniref:Threonine-phosphate decarboxylase n=1 Tax=Clostridium vincentii TaxID=52704 RepID=A0A2T0BCK4_9CLOT|nr:histidinol-phosphate transaminase [Clostridium vincentii]PRR81629.1 Threonine-phosphate decarboxylase [Clostridium vincentii]
MNKLIHGGDIYTKRRTNADSILDFSANINPFGMPDSVKQAIIDNIESYTNYPDPLCRDLRQALAVYENTNSSNIICGNGAADIIFKITLALKPEKALLIAPTFAEYEEAINLVNGEIIYYNLKEENNFYIEADILNYITCDLDIMFICNPNNPTGIPMKKQDLLIILEKCKENNVKLVVDECFIDFLIDEEEYSISSYISQYNNLIILKAFTKIYAMAGIRLGYMLCSNIDIVNKINAIGQPWSVSTVASKCGVAALKEIDYVQKTKRYIKENRQYLIKELNTLGYKVFESQTNFILFKTKNTNIKDKLEEYGILIRSCSNYRNLNEEYFRIAVKSEKNNEYFIDSLKKIERQSE